MIYQKFTDDRRMFYSHVLEHFSFDIKKIDSSADLVGYDLQKVLKEESCQQLLSFINNKFQVDYNSIGEMGLDKVYEIMK